LRRLPPKESASRIRRFPVAGHEDCAELDALPATEPPDRVRAAVTAHIPADARERLQRVEALECETVKARFRTSGSRLVRGVSPLLGRSEGLRTES
jgi:hypothetical protein